jgi:ABC-type nitrate/sulfonate/bicarbonate transport system substrate-binding protein
MRNHFLSNTMKRLVIITLVVSACVLNATAETAQTELTKLKVIVLPYIGYAPIFIAQEEGYFAEQGLEIEPVKMNESEKAIPALLQGDIDVLIGSLNLGAMNAINRGGVLKIVADQNHLSSSGCTSIAFLVRNTLFDAGDFTVGALRGKRIASNPHNIEGYVVEKLLRTVSLTPNDVSFENIPPATVAEALTNGKIDVAQISEPWITRILQTGQAQLWLPVQEILPDFQYAAIWYGPNLLQHNPEAGQRFMLAYLKAVRQYNQGKTARNVDIVVKYTGLDRALVQAACWSAKRNDGQINVDSILEFQAWGVEKGLLDAVVPAEQFWDSRFITYANQALGASTK